MTTLAVTLALALAAVPFALWRLWGRTPGVVKPMDLKMPEPFVLVLTFVDPKREQFWRWN